MNNNKIKAKNSLNKTVTKMAPAVLTAMIATALGFISLYTSPVPMIQDFGKMLTIGLVVSFILGLFFLTPILFTRDYFFNNEKKEQPKQLQKKTPPKTDKVLGWITRKTITFRWVIIIIAAVTAIFGIWVDLDADAETDVETFMPQDTQELNDIHKLRDVIGTTDQISIVYESDDIFSDQVNTWVDNLTESIETEFPEVVVNTNSLTSIVKQMNNEELPEGEQFKETVTNIPEDRLKLFLNESQTKGHITVGIEHLEASELEIFINDLGVYLKNNNLDAAETTITGKSVLDVEMMQGLTTGRYQMTLLGMGLVFISLLLIYRHPVKAFIPLLPIIFIVGWSGLAMYFLDMSYTPLTATLGALIIGIGTEFTVLIMERYYEEREKGYQSREAIKMANKNIGKAVFVSAITTIGGFSALLISDFVILSNFGLMTLINISLALFSTLIVMPPILIILDRFVKIKKTSLFSQTG
ncbi:hypothetical protein CEY16_11570 [Halalkalibacillus sediminis]|uniref:SSD domain-containing protein n=1 Tax=Halalkalibacillus sediminis TaxID=2018042 RepID=A0A2I0QSP1_9BACI|nr:MMPL family transporter [Halalkalibacillus sediminis]PKR77362.1 hypothetical protein CEY16_11570 [Halalkalibacillus sediminis]